ncbi:MAG: hypothetical protein ACK559_42430, partial [bacterium]
MPARRVLPIEKEHRPMMAELHRRAEVQLPTGRRSKHHECPRRSHLEGTAQEFAGAPPAQHVCRPASLTPALPS